MTRATRLRFIAIRTHNALLFKFALQDSRGNVRDFRRDGARPGRHRGRGPRAACGNGAAAGHAHAPRRKLQEVASPAAGGAHRVGQSSHPAAGAIRSAKACATSSSRSERASVLARASLHAEAPRTDLGTAALNVAATRAAWATSVATSSANSTSVRTSTSAVERCCLPVQLSAQVDATAVTVGTTKES